MADYFEEARLDGLLSEYPVGDAFLAGPASLGPDELHAVQERRFLRVVARGWQVPFYARRWRAAGLEPGDIGGLDDIGKLPPFSKRDLMESVAACPPFGDFHGMDPSPEGGGDARGRHATVLHTTSGTTGGSAAGLLRCPGPGGAERTSGPHLSSARLARRRRRALGLRIRNGERRALRTGGPPAFHRVRWC